MQPHGYDALYSVISSLGLDQAKSTLPIGQWPSVLFGAATAWWRYTQPQLGQVHLIGPTDPLSGQPSVHLRSTAVPCDLDFAISGTETITALGIVLDTDHERRMALGRDASDIPVAIEFGTDVLRDDQRIPEPRRTAVMRIILPRSIPTQFWPHNFDVPDREHVTSIGYEQMREVIKNTWRHWID
jgi:hypothetical protein